MYAKIFTKILDSTVARDWYVRHIFMDLLVLADRDGVIDMPLDQIAYRTRGDEAAIARAIDILCAPDPGSRTQEHEGRRLEALDDAGYGWRVLNYQKYSVLKTSSELAEKNRERQKRHRDKKKAPVTDVTRDITPVTEVTLLDLDSSQAKAQERESPSAPRPADALLSIWNEMRGPLAKASMTTKRRRAAEARLRETPDTLRWQTAVLRLTRSKFALGDNERGWRANFDFLLRPDSLTKIEEGQYDSDAEAAAKIDAEAKRAAAALESKRLWEET